VFIENEPGRLADVSRILADNHIDIRALSLADTADFGILRMIVSKPDEAVENLRKNNFNANKTKVIAVKLEDTPGALNTVLQFLKSKNISLEYTYAFISRIKDSAYLILRIEDIKEAADALLKNGFSLMDKFDVYEF
jgi:hypothetical protein